MVHSASVLLRVALAVWSAATHGRAQGLDPALKPTGQCQVAVAQTLKDADVDGCLDFSGSGALFMGLFKKSDDYSTDYADYLVSLCSRPPCSTKALINAYENLQHNCAAEDFEVEPSWATIFGSMYVNYPRLLQTACLIDVTAKLDPVESAQGIQNHPLCVMQVLKTAQKVDNLKVDQNTVYDLLAYKDYLAQHLFTVIKTANDLCTPCHAAIFATWYPLPNRPVGRSRVGTQRVMDHLSRICGPSFLDTASTDPLPQGVQLHLSTSLKGNLTQDIVKFGPFDPGMLNVVDKDGVESASGFGGEDGPRLGTDPLMDDPEPAALVPLQGNGSQPGQATAFGESSNGVATRRSVLSLAELEFAFFFNLLAGVIVFVLVAPLVIV
ncbi:unnamed protein product [Parajaminaea phylloscopi]